MRVGAGYEGSRDTVVRDADCSATNPPALFGCGSGIDARPLGAYGELDRAPFFELAAGHTCSPRSRVELALSHHDLDLRGAANFLGVPGEQPVRANGRSLAALVSASLDLTSGRNRPFLTAGAGAARNTIGDVRYEFPSISGDAVTIVPGATHTSFAWTAGAGVAIPLTSRITLDITLRYTDHGSVQTGAGTATIVRPRGTLLLDIAETRAEAERVGVGVGVRF